MSPAKSWKRRERLLPCTKPEVCTRCFADHTNRANGSPLIKSLFRPQPRGRACYCRQFSACHLNTFVSIKLHGTGCHSRLCPCSCRASTISPKHFPAYSPALPLCVPPAQVPLVSLRCRASHVSSHRRCHAPPPSVLLARHTPLSGLPHPFPPREIPKPVVYSQTNINRHGQTLSHGSSQLTPQHPQGMPLQA